MYFYKINDVVIKSDIEPNYMLKFIMAYNKMVPEFEYIGFIDYLNKNNEQNNEIIRFTCEFRINSIDTYIDIND